MIWPDKIMNMGCSYVMCYVFLSSVKLNLLTYPITSFPQCFCLLFFGEMTLWEKLFTRTTVLTVMMSDWLTELNLWRMVLAETMLFQGICGYWHGADTIPVGHKQTKRGNTELCFTSRVYESLCHRLVPVAEHVSLLSRFVCAKLPTKSKIHLDVWLSLVLPLRVMSSRVRQRNRSSVLRGGNWLPSSRSSSRALTWSTP
jgi:hypothetical protein